MKEYTVTMPIEDFNRLREAEKAISNRKSLIVRAEYNGHSYMTETIMLSDQDSDVLLSNEIVRLKSIIESYQSQYNASGAMSSPEAKSKSIFKRISRWLKS